MMPDEENSGTPLERAEWFATTHWTVVLAARANDSPGAEAALEKLCRTYWHPLYSFLRRSGYDKETAEDLTQSFFADFLQRNSLANTERARGKFRSFLLASLKNFLASERKEARAQKRGGGMPIESFEALTDAERDRLGPVDQMDPEKLYSRRWAVTVLDTARQQLCDEFRRRGKSERYNLLEAKLSGEKNGQPYAELATQLGISVSGVKTTVERMRERFGELVRAEVSKTVSNADEVEEELRYLLEVLSG